MSHLDDLLGVAALAATLGWMSALATQAALSAPVAMPKVIAVGAALSPSPGGVCAASRSAAAAARES